MVGEMSEKNPPIGEGSNMAVLIEMPLTIYQAFLRRCALGSREYELLRNSVVSRAPIYVRIGTVVEFLCDVDDAKLLLTRAKLFYPLATSYIEEGIRLAGTSPAVSQIEMPDSGLVTHNKK